MRSLALVVALLVAGCATRPTTRTNPHPNGRTAPPCGTRTLLLASAAHKPSGAIVAMGGAGFALVWAEQAERNSLRFLLVSREGVPRSPSVEVVDRSASLQPVDVHLAGEAGYEVAWREEGKLYSRQLDPRGRPRADVVADAKPALGTPPQSACAPSGAMIRCKTAHEAPLELPAAATIVSEHIDHDGAAVIAADAAGLKLFAQSCAKE